MKGVILLLLFLVGLTIAAEEVDGAVSWGLPRQRHFLREIQKRQRHSGFASQTSPQNSPQNDVEALYQQKVQFSQKTGSNIPLQQKLDLVKKLPGQPDVSFSQYAGYVTVNDTVGRALFYYFVEATSTPEKKPLVLWLNGGPGCSSIGGGGFEEQGPFRVNDDGSTLYENEFAWNRVANILFLESPAGVGFSYSNDTSDYINAGDTKTSYDSLIFLIRWLDRFPQYKSRDFYITGESYAGHYVPQLTKRVYDFNKAQASPFINLKGFLVGNAVLDSVQDQRGRIEYWWNHGVISDETYAQLKCLHSFPYKDSNSTCGLIEGEAENELGNINPYDFYVPVCLLPGNGLPDAQRPRGRLLSGGYDPCIDLHVTEYLNHPDVQKALHANVTHLPYPWSVCNDDLNVNYTDIADSVIPIFEELLHSGLKIWVLSGDVDGVVPLTSTRYSLQLLKLNTTVPWYAWYLDLQVGGYTQIYDGLQFVTVRDAGHEIPEFQPKRSLATFKSYITGVPLQNSTQAYGPGY